MNNEKKVIETVEPEQEAAAKTTPTRDPKKSSFEICQSFCEAIRLKAMKYGERAEWYAGFGQYRLAEREMQRKRFLFDVLDCCRRFYTVEGCWSWLIGESQNIMNKRRFLAERGIAEDLPEEELFQCWMLMRLSYLAQGFLGGELSDEAIELAGEEYNVVSEKEGGFWL